MVVEVGVVVGVAVEEGAEVEVDLAEEAVGVVVAVVDVAVDSRAPVAVEGEDGGEGE